MPKINRLRIINFAYNHDRRHILDETFNFYGGENALLSLANGGGKSVLVQLILQPVVPGAKLQGRPILSFFRRRKLPAYVLLEWKLDGGGGYLLTGIALASQEAKGVEEDEKSRLKYFTFTVKYPQAHAFDLAHIPLVAKEGGLLEVKSFREAAQLLADKAKGDPVRFHYFPQDDGREYATHLHSFGISQEEWRNVVARINDSESGLKDVFERCRTSDQLLNTWLIKTVEKVIYRDQEAARQLEEMLANLVQEIIDNEQYIIEKEMVTAFLKEFKELSISLGELVNGLDEEQKLKGKLVAFYALVTRAVKAFEEEKTVKEETMEDCRRGLDRLLLEERSYDYHRAKRDYDRLRAEWEEAQEAQTQTEGELEQTKGEIHRQQGARLLKETGEIQAVLAALEEQLASIKEEYDTGGRMQSLEYSLKLGYEKLLAQLEENLTGLQDRHAALTAGQEELRQALEAVDKDRVRLSAEQGKLEERIKSFAQYQGTLERKLGLQLKRDLFGRLDEEDAAGVKQRLEGRCRELALKENDLRNQEKEGKDRLQEIGGELVSLGAAQAETVQTLKGLEAELNRYLILEGQLAGAFRRQDLDFRWRFDREKVAAAFKERAEDLEKRKYAVIRERDRIAEALKALKQGMLHLPRDLADWLVEQDIAFETGERYLLEQPREIREQLLAQNPLLPFVLLMTREDLAKLQAAEEGPALKQVVPIVTYQDLEKAVAKGRRWVKLGEGLSILCYYEGRMFETGGLQALVDQLTGEQAEHETSRAHLEEALNLVRQDQVLAAGFDYPEDYRSRQEEEMVRTESSLEILQKQQRDLTAEQQELQGKLEELERQLFDLRQEGQAANGLLKEFEEFLAKNRDHEQSLQQLEWVQEKVKTLEARKTQLAGEEEKTREELQQVKLTIKGREKEIGEYRVKYRSVEQAAEAPLVEGSVAELEDRLEALKSEYRGNLEQLEKARQKEVKELERKSKELEKLGLPEEELRTVVYDEARADWLEGELNRLEKLLAVQREKASDARAAVAGAKSAMDHTLAEVKRLNGAEPLEPGEIKGDFEARRQELNCRLRALDKERQLLLDKIGKYNRLGERVLREVDVAGGSGEPDLELEADPEKQLTLLLNNYRIKREDNQSRFRSNRHSYLELSSRYREKKQDFARIFAGLDTLWEQAGGGFEGCYYLYERTQQQLEMLQKLLSLYETRLANLERSKQDMVRQSYLHGLQIYEELHKISECSRVRIHGRSRPVDMLKINMELEEGDKGQQAFQRMKQYVEQCISIVRGDLRQGKREEEVAKTIGRLMSSRELLNQLLGTSRIPVQVFKIELNMQHSRHKRWDDAIKENSGGEKFVVFFSVLAALMAYTRISTMGEAGLQLDQVSRVLLMDNPFGPISSEHLLQPLFDIAAKHNTQLICLSDLKQSSIMNCFNLIFMLKVRTGVTGEKEYLKKEEIYKRDNELASGDENLEKALFRASEATQITLFEDFEEYQPE